MRNIKSFIMAQDGSPDLTENIGCDPSFLVPVKITLELADGKKTEIVELETDKLYYHASEGWTPINKAGDECSLTDLLPSDVDADSENVAELSLALDTLGNRVLAKTFLIADRLWGEAVPYVEVHDGEDE